MKKICHHDTCNQNEFMKCCVSWPYFVVTHNMIEYKPLFLFYFILFQLNSFYFISFHFNSIHFILFHFISTHFILFHFNSIHFILFYFNSIHFISFHFNSIHFISFHFNSIHFISRCSAPPRTIILAATFILPPSPAFLHVDYKFTKTPQTLLISIQLKK